MAIAHAVLGAVCCVCSQELADIGDGVPVDYSGGLLRVAESEGLLYGSSQLLPVEAIVMPEGG